MKTLYVGDPHCTVDELKDCDNLMFGVSQIASDEQVDQICILGDLHHNHSIVRLEVFSFWNKVFKNLVALHPNTKIVVIVGNHDMAGNQAVSASTCNAVQMYGDVGIDVVDSPTVIDNVLHLPYYREPSEFIEVCKTYDSYKNLVCHQSFNGSKYENGSFIPDGVDPDVIPQTSVISGHIHTKQDYGKVRYIGSPRWRIATDANVDKVVSVVTRDETGTIINTLDFATDVYCRAMFRLTDTQDNPLNLDELITDKHSYVIDVEGDSNWVDSRIALYPTGVKKRAIRTNTRIPTIRESEGIEVAFKKYLGSYKPQNNTTQDRLAELAKDRLCL